MAKENPGWGYDRIVGALANLGFLLSDQTVGNIPAKEIFAFSKRPTPPGKSTWRGLQGWTYLILDFPVGIRAMGIEVSDQ